MLWRSIHRSASTRKPQPNKRQSVGAGREARSGAITRRGSARQPIWAAWPPSAPSSVSLGRLFTPFSSILNTVNRSERRMLVRARTALLDEQSAGMSFLQVPVSSRRGSSHALVPWNSEQACSASGPTGGHAFSGRTETPNRNVEQNAGHASDMRSGTLLNAARRRLRRLEHALVVLSTQASVAEPLQALQRLDDLAALPVGIKT